MKLILIRSPQLFFYKMKSKKKKKKKEATLVRLYQLYEGNYVTQVTNFSQYSTHTHGTTTHVYMYTSTIFAQYKTSSPRLSTSEAIGFSKS